jgi:hypothetical protein
MGIMNYHCFNKLRESCPAQTPKPQMKMSPTVCAEPRLSLMFVLANFLLNPLLDPMIPPVKANVCSDPDYMTPTPPNLSVQLHQANVPC